MQKNEEKLINWRKENVNVDIIRLTEEYDKQEDEERRKRRGKKSRRGEEGGRRGR